MALQTGKGGEMQIVLRVRDDGTAVIEKFGQASEKQGEKASISWGKIGAAAGAAAAVAATAAAVMIKSSINTADATSKTAAKLGMTTEALSGLTYTAKLADMNAESLNTSLQMMARNLSDAAQGTGLAKDAIKDLGLNAAHLAQMKPDQAVEAIAEAMEKIPNQTDRVSIAMDIFGRSGADMTNVMRGGKDALRAASEEARRFGQIISSETGRNAEAFNGNLSLLKAAATGMANQLAAQMLPALVGISGAMVDTAKNSGLLEGTAKALGVTLQGLTSVGLGVASAFQQTGTWIGAGAAAAVAASQGKFSQAREIVRLAAEDIEKMNAEAAASIARVWSGEVPAKAAAEKPSSGGGASSRSQKARAETAKLKEELAKQLEAIHASTASEQQLLAEKYVKDFQTLQQSLSLKLLTQQQHDEQLQALTATYENKANEKHANDLIRMAERLEALDESLLTEQELLAADYMNKQLLLDDARLITEMSDEAYYQRRAALKNQYDQQLEAANLKNLSVREQQEKASSDRNAAMWASGYRGQLDVLSGVLSMVSNLMQSGSKKQFEIGKKAAIASTLINTYQAAMSAFNALSGIPIVGPILGAVAAVAAIAFGMAQVGKIRSQQFQGGGGAGGAVPTFPANPNTGLPVGTPGGNVGLPSDGLPPPPASAAAPIQRIVNITIKSDSGMVSMDWVRDRLMPGLNEAIGDGVRLRST